MHTIKQVSIIFFFIIFMINGSKLSGQHLKRKALLGVESIEINDSIADALQFYKNKGIYLKKVFPNTTASRLNLNEKDIILEINNQKITDISSFISSLSSLRENDTVTIHYIRDKKEHIATAKAIAKPLEKSDDYDILYDEVKFQEGYIRTIITKPQGITRAPAILFIPGYSCYSLDNIGKHPYLQLISGLTKKGYVVMRAEKLGEGDCYNTPKCTETDFNTELAGFETALRSLKKYDFVDSDNIFIWGHSLGGIEAPLLAERNKIKGIIVNGTIVYSWYEYILQMLRFQEPLLGTDYLNNENMMRVYTKMQYEYLILKKTPKELAKNREYNELLKPLLMFDGNESIWMRNYRYWHQVQDVNQTKALKNSDSYVLSIWNGADLEAFSKEDHIKIAEIVNHYHPRHGTFIELENTTHAFTKVNSMEHGVKIHGDYNYIINNFNQNIVEESHKWIQRIIKIK